MTSDDLTVRVEPTGGKKTSRPIEIGPDVYLPTEEGSVAVRSYEVRGEKEESVADSGPDARFSRSYFFAPVLDDEFFQGRPQSSRKLYNDALDRISSYLKTQPITDLIVIAHGWHRNLFSSMAAYDRLTSIYLEMAARERLQELRPGSKPAIIGVHYHSDPGNDDWVDYSGRRDRESFLRNVQDRIEPRPGTTQLQLVADFEDIFDLFTRLGAPAVDPTTPGMTSRSQAVGSTFAQYQLSGNAASRSSDVLTVAWACYHEADMVGQTVEQDDEPARSIPPLNWAKRVVTLLLTVISSIGFLWSALTGKLQTVALGCLNTYADWFHGLLPTTSRSLAFLALAVGIYLLCWLGLWSVVLLNQERKFDAGQGAGILYLTRAVRRQQQNSGTKFWGTAFFLPLQLVHMVPILTWCLVTPLVGSWGGVVLTSLGVGVVVTHGAMPGSRWLEVTREPLILSLTTALSLAITGSLLLFSRSGYLSERGEFKGLAEPPEFKRLALARWPGFLRGILVWLALGPIHVAKRASRPEQTWVGVWQAIENQIAFWNMADKAVFAGGIIGRLLEQIAGKAAPLTPYRIHLVGHSHGGIVVCNAANWLSREGAPTAPLELQTVITINGAYRSDWFEGQRHITAATSGTIAAMFTRYDTANSLWYPLANLGRKSAGSVGFWLRDPIPPEVGEPLPSVTVSDARLSPAGEPQFHDRLTSVGADPAKTKFLNVDSSRFIFQGPPLPQGAHGETSPRMSSRRFGA